MVVTRMHSAVVRASPLVPGPEITAAALHRSPGTLPIAVVVGVPPRALATEVLRRLSRMRIFVFVVKKVVVVEVVPRLESGIRLGIVLLLRTIMLMPVGVARVL